MDHLSPVLFLLSSSVDFTASCDSERLERLVDLVPWLGRRPPIAFHPNAWLSIWDLLEELLESSRLLTSSASFSKVQCHSDTGSAPTCCHCRFDTPSHRVVLPTATPHFAQFDDSRTAPVLRFLQLQSLQYLQFWSWLFGHVSRFLEGKTG